MVHDSQYLPKILEEKNSESRGKCNISFRLKMYQTFTDIISVLAS